MRREPFEKHRGNIPAEIRALRFLALDGRLGISYLAAMATRLLLTLLALLTGLATQLSPAQARIRAEGAGAIAGLAVVAQSERAAVVRTQAPARPAERWSRREPCVAVANPQAECAPTVRLRIDRARE
jgi:hypothetical protein